MNSAETSEILEQLRLENDGKLIPDDVVEAAGEVSHPLHDYFEWDDDKAGHQHRLWQARVLIRSVRVTVEDRKVPAYVNVKVESIQYYQKTTVAKHNFDEWESALKFAKQRLQAAANDLSMLEIISTPENRPQVTRAVKHLGKAQSALQHASA